MGKYKVIATPSSSLEDKIKAHHSFLKQKQKEANEKSEQYWTPKDWVEAYSNDRYTDKEHLEMLRYITERANTGGNVIIDAHGLENLPKEGRFIMFPNHQGMYDMLAIINVIPRPI